jgi:hypothetical protein
MSLVTGLCRSQHSLQLNCPTRAGANEKFKDSIRLLEFYFFYCSIEISTSRLTMDTIRKCWELCAIGVSFTPSSSFSSRKANVLDSAETADPEHKSRFSVN